MPFADYTQTNTYTHTTHNIPSLALLPSHNDFLKVALLDPRYSEEVECECECDRLLFVEGKGKEKDQDQDQDQDLVNEEEERLTITLFYSIFLDRPTNEIKPPTYI